LNIEDCRLNIYGILSILFPALMSKSAGFDDFFLI